MVSGAVASCSSHAWPSNQYWRRCASQPLAWAPPATTAWTTSVSVSKSRSMAWGNTFSIAGMDEAPRRVAIVTAAELKSASVSNSEVFSVFATRKSPVALYGDVKLTLRLRSGRIDKPFAVQLPSLPLLLPDLTPRKNSFISTTHPPLFARQLLYAGFRL